MRGSSVVERGFHNPDVGGSNPPPATKTEKGKAMIRELLGDFICVVAILGGGWWGLALGYGIGL